MMEEQKFDINDLIIKFLTGEISVEETRTLKELLHNNENKQLFDELKQSWMFTSLYQDGSNYDDMEKLYKKVQNSIPELSNNHPIGRYRKQRIIRYFKIAALCLLLIGLGAITSLFVLKPGNSVTKQNLCEINIPLGSKSHIVLPDGSEVWLNAGTNFSYPATFSSNQRDVYLTGEGYFVVKTNKNWPFVVHTSDVSIKALGTTFNVKAYPTDENIITTLVEGIVKLENEGTSKKAFLYTLKPKAKLTYVKTPRSKMPEKNETSSEQIIDSKVAVVQNNIIINENVNTVLSTSWKDSRWVIIGESIDDLVILLERRYGVKIAVLSPELKNYKFSGIIENETLEQVLKYLKLTIPIKYTVKKGSVELKINESLKENYKTYLKK